MRVVAGSARGRLLRVPPGRGTRPTSDRVREAMFDILTSMDAVEGAAVVDLFAGSGALGVEALSRGAASATFVERDRAATEVIRSNLTVLGEDARRASVVQAEALAWTRRWASGASSALVLADPPYAWTDWPVLLRSLLPASPLVVAESGIPLDAGPAWESVRSRRYGSTVVSVLRPIGTQDQSVEPGQQPAPAQSRGGI